MEKEEETTANICGLIEVSEKEFPEIERVEELRKKIIQEFTGTVLCDKLPKEQPIRGRYGCAYIPLKDDAVPTQQRPFAMHGDKLKAYEKIAQDWIDSGFIERPTKMGIEWSSAGFPVPKKSDTFPWRGVVDVRGPNSQTRKCNYPIPLIEEMLVKHGGSHIYSKLDLKQAFHQQPLHVDSRPITCTHTPFGIFQWKVNVMGLKNAPIQFQQMMDDLLDPVKDICNAYIDDLIISTKVGPGEDMFEKHEKDVRRVLNRLLEVKLIAEIKKNADFLYPRWNFVVTSWVMVLGGQHPEPYAQLKNGKCRATFLNCGLS